MSFDSCQMTISMSLNVIASSVELLKLFDLAKMTESTFLALATLI